jgi:tripartite-type tricarboxylate transporter receptor subunit TctC
LAAGVPGYEIVSWQALFAPAATPQPVLARLYTEIAKILAEPEMRERLDKLGMEASGMAPAQFAEFQKAEIAKWGKVVKTASIKLD